MKKTIVIYSAASILLVLIKIITYFNFQNFDLISFMLINLVLPSVILILANAFINYSPKSSLKLCFVHAVILAVISLAINIAYTQFFAKDMTAQLIESNNSGSVSEQKIDDEIWDELDRKARDEMIKQGLISPDEEIYAEPYMGQESQSQAPETDENNSDALVGEWDVQIEEENLLSTITSSIFDVVLGFIGGLIGMKIYNKKKSDKKE